jgi:titin
MLRRWPRKKLTPARGPVPAPFRPRVRALEDRLLLTVYSVTTTADAGPGSLRQAVLDANANSGGDSIVFNIPGSGAQTIRPASPLPSITGPVFIDGTSQPGYAGFPLVVLDGSSAGGNAAGLWVTAGGSTVRGLAVSHFSNSGILLQTGGGNLIVGNFLGTDAAGTTAQGNGDGVFITGSSNNVIGGVGPAGNVISGNLRYGVEIAGGSNGNQVLGCAIGTDVTASKPLGNLLSGVGISNNSNGNLVGWSAPGYRNIISANGSGGLGDGVSIFSGSNSNAVIGNRIGTDLGGTQPLGNVASGVAVSGSNFNVIGGAGPAGNVLAGNRNFGVSLFATAAGNVVLGNVIGTNASGTKALGNLFSGVGISGGAHGNTVGGTSPGSRNVISANGSGAVGDGVSLYSGAGDNGVLGNLIGTDVTGTLALGNNLSGVGLSSANSVVGGTAPGAGNVISANKAYGVNLAGAAATGNRVEGNVIGTSISGNKALPNANGVGINGGASGNTVGGTVSGAGNTVSGNTGYGVVVFGSQTSGNAVLGNVIGADVFGAKALPNANGVSVNGGASGNTVGGVARGRNLISGNLQFGVTLFGSGTANNLVQGNFIGTDAAGAKAFANGVSGVAVSSGAANNTVGGTAPGAGNLISGNAKYGVELFSSAAGNLVQGNFIGTDYFGTKAVANLNGVGVYNGATNNTVGGSTAGGNVISGNTADGIAVFGAGTTGNRVQGNAIGPGASGPALGNGGQGVDVAGGANGTEVGGTTAPGAANHIAGNGGNGVLVDAATGVAVRHNSIHSNGGLGIALADNANNDQSFPVITTVSTGGGVTTIQGTLTSAPNTSFGLDFFANDACDPSGFGEGQFYIGSATATTNSGGTANFTAVLPVGVSNGQFITATATDPAGNTSAFSACVVVPTP